MTLPGLLLAYASGLVIAPFLYIPPWAPAVPLAAGLLWLAWRRRPLARVLLLLFFATLALARYDRQITAPDGPGALPARVEPKPVVVAGSVDSTRERSGRRGLLDVEVDRLDAGAGPEAVSGRLRVYLDEPPAGLQPGQRVRFRSRLRRPTNFHIPGEFDYVRYLARQGIHTTAFVKNAAAIARLEEGRQPAPPTVRLRAAAGRFLQRQLGPQRAVLLRSLLLGERRLLPDATRDLLARGGISHLFSISGMHLALVGSLLYLAGLDLARRSTRLLTRFPPRRFLPLLILPVLYGYLQLTGGAMATTRAFLVAAGAALYLAVVRHTPPLRLLAAAALALLLLTPLALFEPGFQLSFAGAAGLALFLPRWYPAVRSWPAALRWPAGLVLTTTAATLATLPFVLWHFHLLAPAGLIANLFAVPLIGLVALPAGLAALLLAAPLPPAAAALLLLSDGATRLALEATAWLTSLPGLHGWFWYPPPATIYAVGLLVLAGSLLCRPGVSARWPAGLLVAAGILGCAPPSTGKDLTVTALSVGQGEATLLALPDGRTILVDGGGFRDSNFDVGERLLAPALARLGAPTLDVVVLTHYHPDHFLGLRRVLTAFSPAELWVGAGPGELPAELQPYLKEQPVTVRRFPAGWQRAAANDPTLLVYSPPGAPPSANDGSLVLYVRQGRRGVLLTGDLEAAGVRELLTVPLPGPVDLLKLPHHGSRYSAPKLLFDTLTPQHAFVSAGRDNPYGLPAGEVIAAARSRGIPLWRTDRDGTLRFRAETGKWRVAKWGKGLFR